MNKILRKIAKTLGLKKTSDLQGAMKFKERGGYLYFKEACKQANLEAKIMNQVFHVVFMGDKIGFQFVHENWFAASLKPFRIKPHYSCYQTIIYDKDDSSKKELRSQIKRCPDGYVEYIENSKNK